MKKAYVIPGCTQEAEKYHHLNVMLKEKGYIPIPVAIDWSLGSFVKYMEQVKTQTLGVSSQDIILGFSYGANLALLNHPESEIVKICCSSPDIWNKEKRPLFDRISSGVKVDWNEVDSQIQMDKGKQPRTVFAVGAKEKAYIEFSRGLSERFGSKLAIIEKAGHDINSTNYVKCLEELI